VVRFRDTERLISDREPVMRAAMVIEIRKNEADMVLQQGLNLPKSDVFSPGGDVLQSRA